MSSKVGLHTLRLLRTSTTRYGWFTNSMVQLQFSYLHIAKGEVGRRLLQGLFVELCSPFPHHGLDLTRVLLHSMYIRLSWRETQNGTANKSMLNTPYKMFFTWTVWTRCLLEQLVSNWTLRPVNCIGSTRDNFFEQTDQKMVGWLMESFKQKATHAMQPHHFRLIEGAEFLTDNARDTRPRIIFWAMLQQRSTQFQMCLRFWRLYICLHAYICACTWLRTHLGTQEPTRLRVYLSLWLSEK